MNPISQLPNDINSKAAMVNAFIQKELPIIIGVEAVKLVTRNFENQGFIDAGTTESWNKRKQPGITSPTLTRRAHLRNATRARVRSNEIEIGIDLNQFPQAQILQEGGTIPVTNQMRKFFWAMYHKYDTAIDSAKNSKADYKLSQQANFWFSLTRKKTITIPPRKYIAHQKDLITIVQNIIDKKFQTIFN